MRSKAARKIKYSNTGKTWTVTELRELKKLARKNAPPVVMEIALQRSIESIYSKASKQGISLR